MERALVQIIWEQLEARNWTVTQLAAGADMSRPHLSAILHGHAVLYLGELDRLAAALGTSPDLLVVLAERRVEESTT